MTISISEIQIDPAADLDYLRKFAELGDDFLQKIEDERADELGTKYINPSMHESFTRQLRNLTQGSVIPMPWRLGRTAEF